ncbi:hypothetical protein SAMN05216567_111116 [Variovorax sp. OK605]|uniref:hypothetical protein n=1 Tax=Variovorax sp. OK605 TaxID=1855317 RepID=UPI0008E716F3|nr:hypothetical protein [Variovorax sp. OK605]SFQ12066.1 hypothetical protein SAMN05216567_111116 [Variovorax sp. OK605]
MNTINPAFSGVGLGAIQPQAGLGGLGGVQPQAQGPRVPHGQAQGGAGGLAGRQISVGNGQARADANVHAERAKSFFKTTAKVLAGIVLAPVALAVGLAVGGAVLATRAVLQIPRLINEKLLEPRSDKKFEVAHHQTLSQLRQPVPGGLAANEAVMSRVLAHAEKQGTPITETELRGLVATGERLAGALSAQPAAQHASGSPLTVDVNGAQLQVDSSVHTTRALGWYMMAAAAQQDANRADGAQLTGTSDMTTSGSFVMKDPGNATYKFLAAAPTADSRMSTHFGERVGHQDTHQICGLFNSGKPAQRGIEDYRNMLPGQGGTMLFDKLAAGNGDQELFVKFESVGCPPYFRTEPHQGTGQAVARFFSALDRNIGHATNFFGSLAERLKSGSGEGGAVKRQEHVYKGVLKEPVAKPFAKLIDSAVKSGAINASAKELARSVHKFGLPYVQAAIDRIGAAAVQHGNVALQHEVADMRRQLQDARDELGVQSDRHGVERRGAEVHISLAPQSNRPAAMHTLMGAAAREFSDGVLAPPTGSERAPGAHATGLAAQAQVPEGFMKDFNRATYAIGGQPLAVTGDPASKEQGLQALLAVMPGGQAQLTALTNVAYQRSLAPLAQMQAQQKLGMGDGNPSGMPADGQVQTRYDVQPQHDGSVHLTISHQQTGFSMMSSLQGETMPVDPATSHANHSFTLRVGAAPDHAVTLHTPLQFSARADAT